MLKKFKKVDINQQIHTNTKPGTLIIDTRTDEEWVFIGWTESDSNYSCAKIRKPVTGQIRKLSLFADDGTSRDIARYKIMLNKEEE